jgi:hypothetical protein
MIKKSSINFDLSLYLLSYLRCSHIKHSYKKIIWLFQEDFIIINDNDQSSQYIVNIIKLINVDFTLSRTRRLVQLNFEWMFRNEQQARKRINKITQKNQTYIYALYFKESEVKKMIYDWQNRRTHIMNLTFDSNIINDQNIRREIKNDEKDDDDAKEND